MSRRRPPAEQLTFDVETPRSRSARAELIDHPGRLKAARKREHYSSWPAEGTRVFARVAREPGLWVRGVYIGNDLHPGQGFLGKVRVEDESLSESLRAWMPKVIEVRLLDLKPRKEGE